MSQHESHILVVEDNPDDRRLMLRALRKNKIANRVEVAADGKEALEALFGVEGEEAPPALPQLVLLDLKLPKIDGLEVLREIRGRERTRFLPVVVLTSSDEQRDLVQSYELGVNSYIRKPVDFDAFQEAVKTMGLYWLVLNMTPEEAEDGG